MIPSSSSTFTNTPLPSPNFPPLAKLSNSNLNNIYSTTLNLTFENNNKIPSCLNWSCSPSRMHTNHAVIRPRHASASCFAAATETTLMTVTTTPTADRIQLLVSEFLSLTEPIDRVKRLLDYAARLPPFDESERLPENRVTGCTTQVWLETKMDDNGKMRFRGDSDSEITKGFLSCLVWLLDGAEPEEVLAVKAEDLEAMNVGLYGKAQSRVNTWHNVLISMQKKTQALVVEEELKRKPPPPPVAAVSADDIVANGSLVEAKRSRFGDFLVTEKRFKNFASELTAHVYFEAERQRVFADAQR